MTTIAEASVDQVPDRIQADALSTGVSLMIFLAVFQKLLGFARNLLFCRWMTPEALGHWNLAFSMLVLAAPLVLMGVPGSFGRYVDHYRHKGQLGSFLRRTLGLSALTATAGIAGIWYFRNALAWFFFGTTDQVELLVVSVASLAIVIVFNVIIELFMALRQVRLVSWLQLGNGVSFGVVGAVLILFWQPSASAVVIAYAAACLLTVLLAIRPLVQVLHRIEDTTAPPTHRAMWGRLLPFSSWIWFENLVGNLFGAADRYMIVHFSMLSPALAAGLVGQYHSSLVIPLLLLAVARMVGSVVMPYLSYDWERDQRQEVTRRLSFVIKLFSTGSVLTGCCVLVVAPWIFSFGLKGQYSLGCAVLPWTFAFCIWSGLAALVNLYLYCAERAGTATIGPVLGLIVNVLLNLLLLPRLGLLGAVLATAAGNGVSLAVSLLFATRAGFRPDRGVLVACLLPITLTWGTAGASVGSLLFLAFSLRTGLVFSAREWSVFLAEAQLLRHQVRSACGAWCVAPAAPGRIAP